MLYFRKKIKAQKEKGSNGYNGIKPCKWTLNRSDGRFRSAKTLKVHNCLTCAQFTWIYATFVNCRFSNSQFSVQIC